MFDSRFLAFATVAALLVLSPGPTMAVVLQAAVERGRAAALTTVLGASIGNSTLALGSALGMAALFQQSPWALEAVRVAGAVFLAILGARGLWSAWRRTGTHHVGQPAPAAAAMPARSPGHSGMPSHLGRGILTNLFNPSVILFYTALLPQFIGPRDPFLLRFLVLSATHVSMALVWLTLYALTLGTFADRTSRPAVRRVMGSITGVVLLAFAVRLLLR